MSSFIPHNVWDPTLIISQIAVLQSLFYMSLGCCCYFIDAIFNENITLAQIFSYKYVTFGSPIGWSTILAYVVSSITIAIGLVKIVERARKCLDFVTTIHFIHLIVCIIYGGFPRWMWWIINIFTIAMTAVLGEYLCLRNDLKEIPLGESRFSVDV